MPAAQALVTKQRAAQAPFRPLPLVAPATTTDQSSKTLTKALTSVELSQYQAVDQKQSLEFVQTLLGACVGSLSYLRSLFPDDCFVKTRYGEARSATDYDMFSQETAPPEVRRGTKVTRLTRGVLPEADSLLDWLENGVFRALKDGYLKALQLAVYLDESQPHIVTESYTFSFSYQDGKHTAELHITDLGGTKVTVTEADKSAQQLTRRLLVITEGLKPLPDRRWLTMRMHYRDHTPTDYDPPGFKRLITGSPGYMIPEEEDEPLLRQSCGTMNSGYHSVTLKVMSVGDSSPTSPRKGRRTVARLCPVDMDVEPPHFDFRPTPIATSGKDYVESNNQSGDISRTQLENTQGTSASEEEVRERNALKTLFQKVRPKDDLPPTQILERMVAPSSSPKRTAPDDAETVARSRNSKQRRPGSFVAKRDEQQMVLKPETLATLGLGSPRRTRKRRGGKERSHIISCECGYHEEDGGMICCDICDHWQHAHCYGFFSEKDKRISETHCCYTCLLGCSEKPLLAEMTELAVYRRALRHLWENGKFPSTMDGFAAEVGCDSDHVPAILRRLEEDGFAKSTSRGKVAKNIGMEVIINISNRTLLEEKHFNPRWKVAHHYLGDVVGDTAAVAEKTPETQIIQSAQPSEASELRSTVADTPSNGFEMGDARQTGSSPIVMDTPTGMGNPSFMTVSEVVQGLYVGK